MCMTRVSVLLMYNKTRQDKTDTNILKIYLVFFTIGKFSTLGSTSLKQQLIVKCKCYAYELFTK